MQLIKCEIALDLVWCENYIVLEKMGNMLQVLMSVLILTFFWVALYSNSTTMTYFDSFGVKHIPKEIQTFIGSKTLWQMYLPNTSIHFRNVWLFLY